MNDLACPKQRRCPGCPLGDLPYERGLAKKARALGDALSRYSELQPVLAGARGATPTLAYRLRAKLVVSRGSLGLFERGSHRVIDVEGCRVLSPALTAATAALRRRLPLPIYGADLRETSEGVMLTLLSESERHDAELRRAAGELVESGEAFSVAIAVRPTGSVRLLAGEPRVVAGPDAARHSLFPDAPYAYAAHGGFVQAHAGQAGYVRAEIERKLRASTPPGRAPRVLELFAGSGSLALALARGGADVTAVEAYAPAITLAQRAAAEQRLSLRTVACDATRFMLEQARGTFDAVLVNPPRRGLDPELRAALGRAEPPLLGYVSCNPETLARDAAHLALAGLSISGAEPLDMIPWSDALEALCWFVPARAPAPRVHYTDERWIAVEKAAFEPLTAPVGPSLTARVRALPGCGEAAPVERFGLETSGVCWFDRHGHARDVVGAERHFTLAVRGAMRKQGTINRRRAEGPRPGARYKRLDAVGRHSLVTAALRDGDDRALLLDFISIGHPVLGDALGDRATNQFVRHRYGLDRAFVHCHESVLELADGTTRRASAPLAPELAQLVDSVGSDEATFEGR